LKTSSLKVRAFLGIALTDPVVTTLEHASQTIRDASPAWRGEKWVPPENLHITVRFLGDVPEVALPRLNNIVAQVTSQYPIHDITLTGLSARPRTGSAHMLWATFGGGIDATATMAGALCDVLASAGYGRPEHPFAPHATLVRTRRPRAIGPEALDAARRVIEATVPLERTMSVEGVTLFSSTLTPRGPRYVVMAVADLVRD
jgi:2'-5' RNA ligase